MRMVLTEMGHAQPPTPAVTDSAAGYGFVNNNIYQRRSRAIYMKFYWFRDRFRQGKFLVYWMAGEQHMADCFSKEPPHQPSSGKTEHVYHPNSGRQYLCMPHVT